ncbi:MAG TPA: EAL domain-containing protein [Solirubrobacteraceae bacterium]|nr:EAL domain-containing protein [Solirubrobacteraceae bacterium]
MPGPTDPVSHPPPGPDRRVALEAIARAIGLLFAGGSALSIVWLAIVDPAGSANAWVVVVGALGVATGLAVARWPRTSPPLHVLYVLIGWTTLLTTVDVIAAGPKGYALAFYYLWAAPFAFGILSVPAAGLYATAIGGAYVVGLAIRGDGGVAINAGRWLLLMGTLLALGILVRRLTGSLVEAEQRYRRGFEDSSVGLALSDPHGQIIEVNEALARFLGVRRGELAGRSYFDFVVPEDRETSDAIRREILAGGRSRPVDRRFIRADGSLAWGRVTAVLVRDAGMRPRCFFMQIEDVTAARRAEAAGARRAAEHEAVAHLGQRTLGTRDMEPLLHEAAQMVCETLSAEWSFVEEMLPNGLQVRMRAVAGPQPELALGMVRALERSMVEATMRHGRALVANDLEHEARFDATPMVAGGLRSAMCAIVGDHQRPWGALLTSSGTPGAFSDDDAEFLQSVANVLASGMGRKRIEDELQHQALHDALTGLPNRVLLLDRLAVALAHEERAHRGPSGLPFTQLAVILLDLDNFKLVNDSLGHLAGDELLVTLAQRLAAFVREGDTIARLGGDEFAVLAEEIAEEREAIVLAERIADAWRHPFELSGGQRIVVSGSSGVALSGGRGETPDTLLREADAAMYRAKDRNRGGWELHDEQSRARAVARLGLESALRGALDRHELRLEYQPIVAIESGRVRGVEALLRWDYPDRGPVSPAEFIPIAEDTGLIVPIGEWVLEHGTRQVARWQRAHGGSPPPDLSVNVSGRQLERPDLAGQVARALRDSGIARGSLSLEVTESVLMEHSERPLEALNALRDMGARVVLDDFGTGYSSLSYLRRLPLDAIKIDRAFIAELEDGDVSIVEAVLTMAGALGLDVVAEGVETEHQLACLRDLGCPWAQGFLFSRPLPEAAAERSLLVGT